MLTWVRRDPMLPYTHPSIQIISLMLVFFNPAHFSLRTRLPSGVPEELIDSYYHDDSDTGGA